MITLADVLTNFEETPTDLLVFFPFNDLIISSVSRVFVHGRWNLFSTSNKFLVL